MHDACMMHAWCMHVYNFQKQHMTLWILMADGDGHHVLSGFPPKKLAPESGFDFWSSMRIVWGHGHSPQLSLETPTMDQWPCGEDHASAPFFYLPAEGRVSISGPIQANNSETSNLQHQKSVLGPPLWDLKQMQHFGWTINNSIISPVFERGRPVKPVVLPN